MTKMVTKANGTVTYVEDAFLDSVVEETDTVEDMPTIEWQEPTAEEIADNTIVSDNHQSRQYLADTDWYVTRKAETGKAIPDDILTKREEARAKVKSI